MPSSKKGKQPSTQEAQNHTPSGASSRPRTLLQRVSSGFSSILRSIPRYRRSSTSNLPDRAHTAPDNLLISRGGDNWQHTVDSQQFCIPQIDIPRLTAPEEDCPYNPNNYYSFPSIEPARCSLCGIKSPSRATPSSSKPCAHCRSRSPFSHIISGIRKPSPSQHNTSTAVQTTLNQLMENASSIEEAPRVVTAATATSRTGKPPRRAALPVGLLPSYRPSRSHSAQPASTTSDLASNLYTNYKAIHHTTVNLETPNTSPRPLSPKLHHIIGPSGRKTPFVHKHEVPAHIAALRAGAPSPLTHIAQEPRPTQDSNRSFSYSQTVWYGTHIFIPSLTHTTHRTPPSHPPASRPIANTFQRVEDITANNHQDPGNTLDTVLENTRAYRRHSQEPSRPALHASPTDDSFSTLTTQNPTHVGGKRLELKGGSSVGPRLRGGDGGRGFRLKRWLLTCRGEGGKGESEDEDGVVPVRLVVGKGVVGRRGFGGVGVSGCVGKGSDADCENTVPSLRGGAGDDTRLPPALFWLAGGRGKPVTVKSWKKQKGKKRMGGLLGMAVYGAKAGTEYASAENAVEDGGRAVESEVAESQPSGSGPSPGEEVERGEGAQVDVTVAHEPAA